MHDISALSIHQNRPSSCLNHREFQYRRATNLLKMASITRESLVHYAHLIAPPPGFFLAFAGCRKLLTEWEAGWAVYCNNGFSPAEYRNTAIIELIGSLGMMFRQTRFPGLVTTISMIVWIELETWRRRKGGRERVKSPLYLRIPAGGMQVLLAGLAWALFPSF